jgi:hypothetical protein
MQDLGPTRPWLKRHKSIIQTAESQRLQLAENQCILIFKSPQKILEITEEILSNCFLRLSGRYLSPESSQSQSEGGFEVVSRSTFSGKNCSQSHPQLASDLRQAHSDPKPAGPVKQLRLRDKLLGRYSENMDSEPPSPSLDLSPTQPQSTRVQSPIRNGDSTKFSCGYY